MREQRRQPECRETAADADQQHRLTKLRPPRSRPVPRGQEHERERGRRMGRVNQDDRCEKHRRGE